MSGYLEAMREDMRLEWCGVHRLGNAPSDHAHDRDRKRSAGAFPPRDRGRGRRPIAPVNIAALVRRIRDEALALGQGPVDITLDDGDLFLLGAENEIYSAFSNLVFNAMRYTPAIRAR